MRRPLLIGGLKTPKNTTSAFLELVFCLEIIFLSEFLVIVVSRITVLERNHVSEIHLLKTYLVSEMNLLEINLVRGHYYLKQNKSVGINTQSNLTSSIKMEGNMKTPYKKIIVSNQKET